MAVSYVRKSEHDAGNPVPYCPVCWGADRKTVPLTPEGYPGGYFCARHNNHIHYKTEASKKAWEEHERRKAVHLYWLAVNTSRFSTLTIPSSRSARTTRTAISPRFATSTLLNITLTGVDSSAGSRASRPSRRLPPERRHRTRRRTSAPGSHEPFPAGLRCPAHG